MKKDTVIIRRAVAEDCERLLELVRELAAYEKAPQEVTLSLAHFRDSGFGENPVWWAFVAVDEEVIVAFALYYIRFSTWKGQRMYLEDIIVTKKYRGRGIGKLLMEQLIIEAKSKALQGISWQVLEWNEPAIQFYQQYPITIDKEWWNMAIHKDSL